MIKPKMGWLRNIESQSMMEAREQRLFVYCIPKSEVLPIAFLNSLDDESQI